MDLTRVLRPTGSRHQRTHPVAERAHHKGQIQLHVRGVRRLRDLLHIQSSCT